ncbi:MAG: PqqD family protein [Rhodothermaceae bacterium]|nr:PqqD family protein [Rhodothermaceae bacterium]
MNIRNNIAISESGFVFDPSTGDSFSLNPVGLEILLLIKQGNTSEQISDLITSRYQVEKSVFERYYFDFTSMLKQYHLLVDNE